MFEKNFLCRSGALAKACRLFIEYNAFNLRAAEAYADAKQGE